MEFLGRLLLSWIANAIVLFVVAWAFTDVTYDRFGSLALAAAVYGVLNTIVKPVLKLLTLPFAILTLGLVWFLVSMLMLKVTEWIVPGFDINGFWTLVWATVVAWAVNFVLDFVPGPWRGGRR